MYFQISTIGLPTLETYEQAKARFDKTAPWRGADSHARPLGNRKHKGKLLVALADGSISARLYNTDLVAYHPDGTVSLNTGGGGWATNSTRAFLRTVAPTGLWFDYHTTVARKNPSFAYYTNILRPSMSVSNHFCRTGRIFVSFIDQFKQMQWHHSSGWLKLRKARDGWTLLNPEHSEPHHVLRINKERSAAVRSMLKPFIAWVRSVLAMNNGDLSGLFVDRTGEIAQARGLTVTVADNQTLMREIEQLLDKGEPLPVDLYPSLLACITMRRQTTNAVTLQYRITNLWRAQERGQLHHPQWHIKFLRDMYAVLDAYDFVQLPIGAQPIKCSYII